jgi:hypothetical protein
MAHTNKPFFMKRRFAPLHEERGAAVFIVLMAITLLTAVGIYAARAATLVDQGAGYDRQSIQAHYLAIYAVLATSAELSSTRGAAQIRTGQQQADTNCPSLRGVPAGATVYCHQIKMSELAESVDTNFSGHQFLQPAANGSPFVPGSLGPYPPSTGAAVNGYFDAEITEYVKLPFSPGMDMSREDLVMWEITVTGHGVIGRGDACDASTTAAGEEQVRAHVLAGPMAP